MKLSKFICKHLIDDKVFWSLIIAVIAFFMAHFTACEIESSSSNGIETTTFTVTYNLNRGTGTAPTAATVNHGETIATAPDTSGITPPNTGESLTSWNTAADGSGTDFVFGITPVIADVELFAQWNIQYTVTYDLNGAAGTAPTAATVNYGETIASAPTEPTRKDYTFNGWYDDYTGGNEFSFGTSGTVVTANITLYAGWAIVESTTTYSIGDTGPAGGIVFYVKTSYSDGWRYLEAPNSNTSTGIEWGGFGPSIGTSTDIGTGKVNTKAIVNKLGSGNYAAHLCYDLVQDGYDDWFLPSKVELNELYNQKDTVGGFASKYYWSSSGSGSNSAWGQYFSSGYQYVNYRVYNKHVRAVRAF